LGIKSGLIEAVKKSQALRTQETNNLSHKNNPFLFNPLEYYENAPCKPSIVRLNGERPSDIVFADIEKELKK